MYIQEWKQASYISSKHLPIHQLNTHTKKVTPHHCRTKLLLGRCNTQIFPPQIEKQWQTKIDTVRVQLGKPWVLLRLLTGAEMTQRQLHHYSPPQHGWWVTAHKSWEPGAHCTSCRQLTRLENVLSRWLWSKPLPGSWFLLLLDSCSGLKNRLYSLACLSLLCRVSACFHLTGTQLVLLTLKGRGLVKRVPTCSSHIFVFLVTNSHDKGTERGLSRSVVLV